MRITNPCTRTQRLTTQTGETEEGIAADIEAESIGWRELAPGTYLHTANEQALTIDIVGIATAGMAGDNVLWLV